MTSQTGDPRVVELTGVIAFPSLLEARLRDTGSGGSANAAPMYEATILIPKTDTKQIDLINIAVAAAARDKWGDKPPAGLRLPLRKGEEKAHYTGFTGNVYIAARSKDAPLVLAWREKRPAVKADVVAGFTALLQVRSFAYDRNGNKGVSFGLQAVWFLKRGERLDGRPSKQQLADGLGAGVTDADVESAEEVEEALAAATNTEGGGGKGGDQIPDDLAAIMSKLSKVA
jgi:hypothetical protein